jgi:DNA repair protein RecO (recombination protein O)
MRVEQQPAFVLHARPWRETSLLLEVLSRDHGRVGLVARGCRRERPHRPRTLLQPLVPLSLSWSGQGELATLGAAEASGPALALSGSALLCALYVNEVVARLLPRHDPHPALFADYLDTLRRLARGESEAWTLRRFERDLLAHLGYGLSLEYDAESGAPLDPEREYAYRLETGPLPWRGPQDGLRLRGRALLALVADREPAAEDLAALKRLLRALIAAHLDGGELRAWHLFGDSPVNPFPARRE